MKLLRSIESVPEALRGAAVSVGNFDGVHLGHQRIMRRLVEVADRLGRPAVAFTFDPTPLEVLRPGDAPPRLCWTERKLELLERLGVAAAVVLPTDRAFLDLAARWFFDDYLMGRLAAAALVEGYNFRFGRGRSGDVGLLAQWCAEAGARFELVEPVPVDGTPVSSSRVREAVAAGRVDLAARLLGRPHRIRGVVVRGAGRGAGLGFPTANIAQTDTILPAEGIYAGLAHLTEAVLPAAISLGPNPTFDESGRKIEVYILDFHGDLYGQLVQVDFLARLRDIERFGSVEQLVAAMRRDVESVRRVAAGAGA